MALSGMSGMRINSSFGQQPLLVHPLWMARGHALNQLQTISTLLQQEFSRRDDTLPHAVELNANAHSMHRLLTTLLPHLAGESALLVSTINWAQPSNHPDNRAAFSANVKEYQLMLPNRSQSRAPLPLNALVDGTGNTVFHGQVTDSPTARGDPLNLRDPARAIHGDPAGYSGPEDRTCFLFGDGSVRALSKNTAPEVQRALSTPAGGEHASGL